jgi:hypothetical protein
MSATCTLEALGSDQNRIATVTVNGYVSLACFNEVTAALEEGIRDHFGKMRMLEIVERFSGLDPMAFVPNSLFNMRNFSAFERIAIVGHDPLLMSVASSLSPLVPGDVRTFPLSDAGKKDASEFIRRDVSATANHSQKRS